MTGRVRDRISATITESEAAPAVARKRYSQPDESLTLRLSYEEATELSAMLRSVLGQGLSTEEAVTLGL